MPPISVLDLSPVAAGSTESQALRDTIELARHAERLGYHRYWLAEHHGGAMVASSSPELMIGQVAAATERIRVGSGGVMLPNHSPLRVAEQFKVLSALFPDRIDLGIGRAPGTDQMTAYALRRSRDAMSGDDFPAQLGEMLAFAGERAWPDGHPFTNVRAAPVSAPLPPIFLLGSSDFSAQLAASAGMGFAFAAHINPALAVDGLRIYRERFEPSEEIGLAEPYAILAHAVIVADDDERARQLAAPARVAFRRLRAGRPTPLPSVEDALAEEGPPPPGPVRSERMITGSPTTVRDRLDELLSLSGADEVMAMTNVHDFADRLRSLELLADAYSLRAPEGAAASPLGVSVPAAFTDLSLDALRERRSAKWTQYEPDVLPAWVAEMDFPLAEPIKAALRAAVDRDDAGYANAAASRLAPAFAGFADRRYGWRVDPEGVIACNDVVHGLRDLLRALLEPGEGVVITPPVYHPFFSLVPEAGCEVLQVPLVDGRHLDLDGIGEAFAAGARALLLCNPHNPTGGVATRAELTRLAELAAEHDAWILSDEIHAPLTLAGAEHIPFITVSEEAAARGIVLVSASKTFNLAGLGCAQIVTAPGPAREAAELLPFGSRHPGHFGTIASEAAYESGDEWLSGLLEVLDSNRRLLAEQLLGRIPEIAYEPPQAGYLAWLDCSQLELGEDPAAPLLERGRVALSPGPQFGRGGAGHVRLNFGTSPALVAEAVERMARAIGR